MATPDFTQNHTRLALYARVSTINHGQDVGMQLEELREYAARRGCEVAAEYIDQGVSGSKDSRPALNRLMADAHTRRFDAIVCWKLDRFGRSLKHLVNAIADIEALGIAFISLRDNLDLSTPSGRLMFQIIGAMAEFERALIQERVRAGLRNARAKGVRLGRPPIFVSSAHVARLRADGLGWKKIAAQLGCAVGTVLRVASQSARAPAPAEASPAHERDADCMVDGFGLCTGCGANHSQQCDVCRGRGYHKPGCGTSAAGSKNHSHAGALSA